MQSAALVLIFCLFLGCNGLQNETCNFKVAYIDTAENVSCLIVMDGRDPVCNSIKSTKSCHIQITRDNKTCIKWPEEIELTCLKDSDETLNKLNTDENMCARDQESISCDGEYKSDSEPGNSASTQSLTFVLITAAIAIVHWGSL
ncbi:hypothetical protein Q8A67_020399 [Cirrhinus molitorella]|uniref:Uncharacterized protein n=1 Tax=Cirrhinus molitorella TaxID=172907 RepID=A0AA88TCT9_9TELE|nr:hypothetical protein Q8A67_020399 [Cirrhinus molitorella]